VDARMFTFKPLKTNSTELSFCRFLSFFNFAFLSKDSREEEAGAWFSPLPPMLATNYTIFKVKINQQS
jgi:hypothetical protein